jgi:hypothetical protein
MLLLYLAMATSYIELMGGELSHGEVVFLSSSRGTTRSFGAMNSTSCRLCMSRKLRSLFDQPNLHTMASYGHAVSFNMSKVLIHTLSRLHIISATQRPDSHSRNQR